MQRFGLRPTARRPVLALAAAAIVTLAVTACVPPAAPTQTDQGEPAATEPVLHSPSTTSAPAGPSSTTVPPATTQPPITTRPGSPTLLDCPITGARYDRNSYGRRPDGSFHYGTDMFAATGTQERAVRSGNVKYATESAGGKVAYLYADDGNVYYYAHMSQFQGTDRRVTTGTVLGLLGQTGNATAPHLHFEVRVGNVNGNRVDPYPVLQAAHC